MTKQAKRSPALVELIVIICFLAIALTVVVQLFAEVYLQNRDIAEQSNALLCMQDNAEQLKADGPPETSLQVTYYDENFKQPAAGKTPYFIELRVESTPYGAGVLYNYDFVAYKEDAAGQRQEVARLESAQYVPGTGGVTYE